jgi:hypothetical protein
MPRQRHTRVGGKIIPRDETIKTNTVAVTAQARDRRKKGAKSLTLQKDCKAMVFFADCPAGMNAETAALRFEP